MHVNKHLDMLGRRAEDRVTGFKGVISSIYFDLYGCIQAVVTPPVGADGKKIDAALFDVSRLTVAGDPVMERPDWSFGPIAEGRQGPSEKPAPYAFTSASESQGPDEGEGDPTDVYG